MKKIVALFVALFMGVALSATAPVANAAPSLKNLVCTGTVVGDYSPTFDKGGKVVPPAEFDYKSVTVPEGESCRLVNVAVKGNVKALHGAVNVKVLDSWVLNNVHVKGATGLVKVGQKNCAFDPGVRGNVLVYDSHDVLICFVDGHNIQVKRNDGRITVRDSFAHRFDVSQNKKFVGKKGTRKAHAIRVLRNDAEVHIHVFNNHKTRPLILRDNTPAPVVK